MVIKTLAIFAAFCLFGYFLVEVVIDIVRTKSYPSLATVVKVLLSLTFGLSLFAFFNF